MKARTTPVGARKDWCVTMTVDGATAHRLTMCVYIDAVSVVKTAHDQLTADGVVIGLPGNIKNIKIHRRGIPFSK